ncbi:hypothetical protein DVH24_027095 [Malus domestica]|uniref:STAG domain-containing protein n=1 Tax=Malus domestica TaxID=3750 RepID=A0A498ILH6_MALDO|nr:hypothetical protein DVH24_027095 [Malus domestica]
MSSQSEKSSHQHGQSLCPAAEMPPSGLNEEKPKGFKVWSLQPQPTTMVDGDKNCHRTTFSSTRINTKGNAEDYQISKMELHNFKDNLQCLWDNLVGECQHGPLVDQFLFNKCMDYIIALSHSTPRTHRRAATLRGLQLVTSFISVARRETTRRELDAEKKKQTVGPLVESLNKRFSMTHDKITMLEKMMCKISKGHQLVTPQIRHVTGALEYEHLIAQDFNSTHSGAKGFSCHDHGTINIAYRWGNFICVGVDSKLSNALTGDVTNLTYNKFFQISRNIYITMAGLRMPWEDMWQWIVSMFSTIPEESRTVELAANLAYQFGSPYGTVCSLVLGWDITSPRPQMFRVIAGISLTTSDNAMALGTGEQYINLRYLTDYDHRELAHAFDDTMFLLSQACHLDRFCGGIVRGRVLQRDQPPFCQYLNFFY